MVSGERQPVTPSPAGEPQPAWRHHRLYERPLKWLRRRKALQSSSSSLQRCTHSVFSATFRVLSLPGSEASSSLFKTFQNPGRRASLVVPTVNSLIGSCWGECHFNEGKANTQNFLSAVHKPRGITALLLLSRLPAEHSLCSRLPGLSQTGSHVGGHQKPKERPPCSRKGLGRSAANRCSPRLGSWVKTFSPMGEGSWCARVRQADSLLG